MKIYRLKMATGGILATDGEYYLPMFLGAGTDLKVRTWTTRAGADRAAATRNKFQPVAALRVTVEEIQD